MNYLDIEEYMKLNKNFKDGKIKEGQVPDIISFLNEYKDDRKEWIADKLKILYTILLLYKYQEGKGKQQSTYDQWYENRYVEWYRENIGMQLDCELSSDNINYKHTKNFRDSFTLEDLQEIYHDALYNLSIFIAGENRESEQKWINKIPKVIPEELYLDNLFVSKDDSSPINKYFEKYKKDFKNDYIVVYVIHPLVGWYYEKEKVRSTIIDDVRKYYNNTDKHIEILDDEVNYFEDDYKNDSYTLPNQKELYDLGISIKYLSRANIVYNISTSDDDTTDRINAIKLNIAKVYNKDIINSNILIGNYRNISYISEESIDICAKDHIDYISILNTYNLIPDISDHLVIIMKYLLKFRYHDKYKDKAWVYNIYKNYRYINISIYKNTNIKNIIGSNYILDKAYEQARKDAMKDCRCKDIYIPEERPEDFILDNLISNNYLTDIIFKVITYNI